jgi:hypothetical protein
MGYASEGFPEEVASTTSFTLIDKSNFTTGASILVDGICIVK